MAYTREYPIDVSYGGSSVRECIVNNDKDIKNLYEVVSKEMGLAGSANGTRQCVLSGPVNSAGMLDIFVPINEHDGRDFSYYVGIAGDNKPIIVDFADGFNEKGAKDIIKKIDERNIKAWPITTLGKTQWLYIEYSPVTGSISFGTSDYEEIYDYKRPDNPAKGQHWFDRGEARMKYFDGAAWQTTYRVFVGRAFVGTYTSVNKVPEVTPYPVARPVDYNEKSSVVTNGDGEIEFRVGDKLRNIRADRFLGAATTAYNIPVQPGLGNIWIEFYSSPYGEKDDV